MPFKPSELEAYATTHRVPILHKDSVASLQSLIRTHAPTTILEVGTAIGYSAMQMASVDPAIRVITLERDPLMVTLARDHITHHGFANQIQVIATDAALYAPPSQFDLVFIDAGKAQYQAMFERFAPFLSPKGLVVCDNYYMHGLTVDNAPPHQRTMARKLEAFKAFLAHHPDFHTVVLDVGDGLSVSVPHER
jgi:predicted O-methyltransferase YrrM